MNRTDDYAIALRFAPEGVVVGREDGFASFILTECPRKTIRWPLVEENPKGDPARI